MGWETIPGCTFCGCGPGACVCQACFLCKEVHRRGQAYPCAWNYVGEGFESGDAACAAFNGAFRMTPNGTCSWRYSDATRTVVWIFNVTDVRWELRLTSGATTITYAISGPDWQCCGSNFPTLLTAPPGACAALPETVAVQPEIPKNCECPPDPCACFPCPLCDNRLQQFPCQWRFVGTGFGDDSAVDCTRFNRNLLLSMTASCKWEYDDPTDVHVILNLSDDVAILTLFSYTPPGNEVFVARYALAGAAWNCCSNNALPLVLDGNQCGIGGVPATLTLQPVTPCGCGGGIPALCCAPDCRTGISLPREWTFTIAGITNDTFCQSCNEFNGNFTLRSANACFWNDFRLEPPTCYVADITETPLQACHPRVTWILRQTAISYILTPNLYGFIGFLPRYVKPIEEWNCTGPNVMTFEEAPFPQNKCRTFPPTVTVTPGANMLPVCECWPPYDAIAVRWRATFAGVQGPEGCCGPLRDGAVLSRQEDPSSGQFFCRWSNNYVCPGNGIIVVMAIGAIEGAVLVEVATADGVNAFYIQPLATFNPVGANVLTRVGPPSTRCFTSPDVNGPCSDFPAQISLIPD